MILFAVAFVASPSVMVEQDPRHRSFYMGCTPFKYSRIEETIETTYQQIRRHGDMILHHLDDGVPWVESFDSKPFHQAVEDNLRFRRDRTDLSETKNHIRPLLPYSDFFSISTYPYMIREGPGQTIEEIPVGWFTQVCEIAPDKPFAIAETGYIAEDLSAFWKKFRGTPDHQKRYVGWVFHQAKEPDAEFVI